jgi:3-mercaptopyruvate sulfurtransferase SseA
MLKKLPVQIVILLLIGILLGVANNLVSPNRIPWIQEYRDASTITQSDTVWHPFSWEPSTDTAFKLLNTEMAYRKFVNERVVFIDARSAEEYAEGHIQGAHNIDFEYADDQTFNMQIDSLKKLAGPSDPIITYCSGTECDASLQLARYLSDTEGFDNIHIFFGGWTFWTENDLPIESDIHSEGESAE